MCGIVGAVAKRNVVPILLDGLKRLEYRGYDSAGLAVLTETGEILRHRAIGKVAQLQALLEKEPLSGQIGIAHTRWATHGIVSERNAHPHIINERVVLVHNGIIENYQTLKDCLTGFGYHFSSETDSEVIAAFITHLLKQGNDLLSAVSKTAQQLEGSYAFCVMDAANPTRLVGVRSGPPLAVGLGEQEYFLASDALALQRVAEKFIYLEDGDIVDITTDGIKLFNKAGEKIERQVYERTYQQDSVDKGGYRHFMLKEIFEQPTAIQETLLGRLHDGHVLENSFGASAHVCFDKIKQVQIIACGTSFHAGLVGRLWLEGLANLPCQVEIASEFRYRQKVLLPDTLYVFISQSGETADTLAALRNVKTIDRAAALLAICNVPDSSLVREAQHVFLTAAGPEIGVCSTKAFTTQLVALFLLSLVLGRRHGLDKSTEQALLKELVGLTEVMHKVLSLAPKIEMMAKLFSNKAHTLFLGRGLQFPIALEGALKLKEISYIHAEAYPAGELKHGPLALVDKKMPIVVIAPRDRLFEKLKSNIQEVRARGGEFIVFTTENSGFVTEQHFRVLELPPVSEWISPILLVIPLQLLSYYVAVLRGTDVDQPRNLAKSVTVE
jgi:glucosamine--fructose-6-phosphate aminotransferase (isomerizing)